MHMLDKKAKRTQHNPTTIIIDEISLCGKNTIEWFKYHYPYAKIYCLGDEL